MLFKLSKELKSNIFKNTGMTDQEIREFIGEDSIKRDTQFAEYKVGRLLEAKAPGKYLEIISTMTSPSADKCIALENELNARKQKLSPGSAPLVVLDPDLFSIGVSFGMTGSNITHFMLKSRGFPVGKIERSASYTPLYNKITLKDGQKIHYILTAGDYYKNKSGLDRRRQTMFSIKHESSHFLDPVFVDACCDDFIYEPKPYELIEKPEKLQSLHAMIEAEMFADLCALAEMVQNGEDIGIIDILYNSRLNVHDIGHCTAQAIKPFKENILSLGLENLKKMDDQKLIDFCINHVKQYSPTQEQLLKAAKIVLPAYGKVDKNDPDYAAANFYASYLKSRTTITAEPDTTPEDEAWLLTLKNHAFKRFGKIMPEGIAISYVEILGELREEENSFEKIDQLVRVFGEPINYIAENRARGVDILPEVPEYIIDPYYFDPKYLPAVKL